MLTLPPMWDRWLGIKMRPFTARILLTLLPVGVLAPVALAITGDPPHACCLRKRMRDRGPHQAEFNAPPGCCNRDCCRPLTISHWAELTPPVLR